MKKEVNPAIAATVVAVVVVLAIGLYTWQPWQTQIRPEHKWSQAELAKARQEHAAFWLGRARAKGGAQPR
jgi:hypothetical protein